MKDSKRNIVNLIFSSFLVIGYIICTYFFSSLASKVNGLGGLLIQVLILLVFGLLLFYATRVGEGKQVKRFSLPVLLLVDVPCLYIIFAALLKGLPLNAQLAPVDGHFSVILILASVALGYGIPYTFVSGYELQEDAAQDQEENALDDIEFEEADDADEADEKEPVKGGIAEELAEDEKDDEKAEKSDDKEDDEADDDKDADADDKEE